MKLCNRCFINKNEMEFYKMKLSKDGLGYYCKKCVSKEKKEYYQKNKIKIILKQNNRRDNIEKYNKEYKKANKIKTSEYNKIYNLKNKEKNKENRKNKYKNNKEFILSNLKEYRLKNPPNRDTINKRFNYRYNNDILFKLRKSISVLIRKYIKNAGYIKNEKTIKILGCSFDDLLLHLNKNTYGFKYEDNLYDIDHIIPISTSKTEDELIKLNHYTNLQLLPSKFNRYIKRDNKWDQSILIDYLNKS